VHCHLAQYLSHNPANCQALLAAAAHEDGQEGGGDIRHLTLILDLLLHVQGTSSQVGTLVVMRWR
jgi:hypothetical protein